MDINVREYRRGNQKWTIERNWQHRVQEDDEKHKKHKNTTQYMLDTTTLAFRYSRIYNCCIKQKMHELSKVWDYSTDVVCNLQYLWVGMSAKNNSFCLILCLDTCGGFRRLLRIPPPIKLTATI